MYGREDLERTDAYVWVAAGDRYIAAAEVYKVMDRMEARIKELETVCTNLKADNEQLKATHTCNGWDAEYWHNAWKNETGKLENENARLKDDIERLKGQLGMVE